MSVSYNLWAVTESPPADALAGTLETVISTIEQGIGHRYLLPDPLDTGMFGDGVAPYYYQANGEIACDRDRRAFVERPGLVTILMQLQGGIFSLYGPDYLASMSLALNHPSHRLDLSLIIGKVVLRDTGPYDPQSYRDFYDTVGETFLRTLEFLPAAILGSYYPDTLDDEPLFKQYLAQGHIPPLSDGHFTVYGPQILARFPAGAINELVREGFLRIRPLPHGALAIWQEEKVDNYPQYHVERRLGIDLSYLQLD